MTCLAGMQQRLTCNGGISRPQNRFRASWVVGVIRPVCGLRLRGPTNRFYMASASASKTSLIVGDSKLYEAWHSKKHFDQTLLADTNMVDKDKAAAIEKLMQKDDWRSEVQASLATSLTQAYLEMLSELPFTRSFGNRPLQTIRKQH